MNFTEYKSTINCIESCEPCEGWNFDRMLTLLNNVVLKLDALEAHVDDGLDKIDSKL